MTAFLPRTRLISSAGPDDALAPGDDRDGGHCHQLSRSPVPAGRHRRDRTRHPADQHPVRGADILFPAGLRPDVRRRRRTHRSTRHPARLRRDHGVLVARLRESKSRTQLHDAGRQPVPARGRRGRRLSGGNQGHRRVVPGGRAVNRDGACQRGDGHWGRGGPARDCRDSRPERVAHGLCGLRPRRAPLVDLVAALDAGLDGRARCAGRSSRRRPRRRRATQVDLAARPRGGARPGRRQVPHGRRVVLLHRLATQVSL